MHMHQTKRRQRGVANAAQAPLAKALAIPRLHRLVRVRKSQSNLQSVPSVQLGLGVQGSSSGPPPKEVSTQHTLFCSQLPCHREAWLHEESGLFPRLNGVDLLFFSFSLHSVVPKLKFAPC